MNRREFLTRMLQAGLVAASPKLIFDCAPKHRSKFDDVGFVFDPDADPFRRSGYFISSESLGLAYDWNRDFQQVIISPREPFIIPFEESIWDNGKRWG